MAILTARYTVDQRNTEGLNTTPFIYNNAMGIVGADPSNREQIILEFISKDFPNSTFEVSSNQAIINLGPNGVRDIFTGTFPVSYSTANPEEFISRISGTISGWSAGVYGAENNRYTVTGINIDAQKYFSTITWVDILDGGDTLVGGPGSDTLQSYGSNNIFRGLGGNDVFIAAKGGVSLAIFRGSYESYSISKSDDISYDQLTGLAGHVVNDSIAGRDGYTQLINIERLQFSDINIALDVGPSENAGSLYMLYKAAFNRAPDEGGMGYWLAQVDGGKNLVNDIAAGFVKAPEFVAKYGTNPTNAFYVDQLYLNVLGRPGEAGGVAYWNQELNSGARSKAEVLVQFATLPEGAALVANLIANGIPYQEWVG